MRLFRGERLLLSAAGVAVLLVASVAYLYAGVLGRPLTHAPTTVTVDLRAAGGLYEGSAVTYRGVTVGKVTDIAVTRTGVQATISLTSSRPVPADTTAVVRSLSPVGEQYLDLQPRTDAGPYLADGDVVPASSTDVPLSLASTVVSVNKVLRQIDDTRLRSLLVNLAQGLQGTGDDLGRLTDQGQQLLDTLDRLVPTTDRLLRNGGTVLDIGTDHRGDLVSLARHAKALTAYLRAHDGELRRVLRRTPAQLTTLQGLVEDARRVLPGFLSVGVSLSDIIASRDPAFRALLRSYAPGLAVLPAHVRDRRLQLLAIGDSDPRCGYGTTRRSPRDTTRHPLQTDGRCSASFAGLQRGAAHAPGTAPTGD